MTHRHQRRRLFIDRPIQITVLFRALWYWAVCLVAQLLIVFFFATATSTEGDFSAIGPQLRWHLQLTVIAAAVLLPIILLDILKLSHRWVGPIFRLRTSLHSLSRGESVPAVRFRENDFWQELAGDLNVVAAELDRHRTGRPQAAVVHSPPVTVSELDREESRPTSSAI